MHRVECVNFQSKRSNTNKIATVEEELSKSVRYIKGVGERLALVLARKQIISIRDALFNFPRSYEDRRKLYQVREAKLADYACVIGKIQRAFPVSFTRSKKQGFEVVLEDLSEPFRLFRLKWFHKPYLANRLEKGHLVIASGAITRFGAQLQMAHPEMEILGRVDDVDTSVSAGIVPVYSQTEGLYQKTIRKIENEVARNYAQLLEDPVPDLLRHKHELPTLSQAVKALHCPDLEIDWDELIEGRSPAHRRLIYGEFFLFSCVLAMNRRDFVQKPGISFPKPKRLWDIFAENLSFKFTKAQKRVVQEILEAMQAPKVMFRLVQGDVGSGKTAVAAAAALVALEAGYQVAMMAPTEVLVDQHIEKFRQWFKATGIYCLKLTGSMSASEVQQVLKTLAHESSVMIFGTQAIFEERVKFKKLGLVIMDEQHRFGVRQRASLIEKAEAPDVLVMTATPIPRSLALTLYGDLDISVIDELPPGRKPIETKVFTDSKREQMLRAVRAQLVKGRQAYVVFPLIEESEKLALKSIQEMMPKLMKEFEGFRLEQLHGRLAPDEKSRIIEEFRQGKIQVLISTTVIEVGVDVQNACVMIVENAERFGLSQLHQLRGRVGRGGSESFCFLMASHLGSPEIVKRLRSMEKTQDGFKLSEVDLEMRGPGEFLGTKQSGVPEFQLARLPKDLDWLKLARSDAFELIEEDPELKGHLKLKAELTRRFQTYHPS